MSPRKAPRQKKRAGPPSWLIVAGIVVVVVFVAIIGADFFSKFLGSSEPGAWSSGLSAKGRTVGNPNSKVAFVEFSDFQ
ncbi:MAG: hypothetical protein KGJ80_07835 [Chloroflexota bacterium]|nr:hypothetical protein [Chloroflexota bacterium]